MCGRFENCDEMAVFETKRWIALGAKTEQRVIPVVNVSDFSFEKIRHLGASLIQGHLQVAALYTLI